MMQVERGRYYRHLKRGTIYKVLDLALEEATQLVVVIYAAAANAGGAELWTRPIAEFGDGRFEPAEGPAALKFPTQRPHVMLDLETMGTLPGSAILSIGAVSFDLEAECLLDRFYNVISLRSCQDHGLGIDADTVLWWLQQSDAARAEFNRKSPVHDLRSALSAFTGWWKYRNPQALWCHGANFDEPLLIAAFRAAALAVPWHYSAVRCTRTIFALAGERPDRREGTHHNALDDAAAQAEAVIRSYRRLRTLGIALSVDAGERA